MQESHATRLYKQIYIWLPLINLIILSDAPVQDTADISPQTILYELVGNMLKKMINLGYFEHFQQTLELLKTILIGEMGLVRPTILSVGLEAHQLKNSEIVSSNSLSVLCSAMGDVIIQLQVEFSKATAGMLALVPSRTI